jgi:hypothetical protein
MNTKTGELRNFSDKQLESMFAETWIPVDESKITDKQKKRNASKQI